MPVAKPAVADAVLHLKDVEARLEKSILSKLNSSMETDEVDTKIAQVQQSTDSRLQILESQMQNLHTRHVSLEQMVQDNAAQRRRRPSSASSSTMFQHSWTLSPTRFRPCSRTKCRTLSACSKSVPWIPAPEGGAKSPGWVVEANWDCFSGYGLCLSLSCWRLCPVDLLCLLYLPCHLCWF